MNESSKLNEFCTKMKDILKATECISFASKLESVIALFEVIQLRPYDCVFVSALAPRYIVGAIIMCGATPVFCDVTPDSLTLDHRSLEASLNRVIEEGTLYPRAVIAENYCGMPVNVRVLEQICNRMGLIFIEECGGYIGGSSDMGACGTIGDYSLISLGNKSIFGTGGNGALLVSHGENAIEEYILHGGCGLMYQCADEHYADELISSIGRIDDAVQANRGFVKSLEPLANECDCWLQRGSNRFKSSFGGVAVIAQEEELSLKLLEVFDAKGLSQYVYPMHSHAKSCYKSSAKGIKELVNSGAIAKKSFIIEVSHAVSDGKAADILKLFEEQTGK